jgi:hypothetical protein
MNVASAAGKFGNFPNLSLPVSGLYLLAEPNTPAEVIEAVTERGAEGERSQRAPQHQQEPEGDGACEAYSS